MTPTSQSRRLVESTSLQVLRNARRRNLNARTLPNVGTPWRVCGTRWDRWACESLLLHKPPGAELIPHPSVSLKNDPRDVPSHPNRHFISHDPSERKPCYGAGFPKPCGEFSRKPGSLPIDA